MTICSRRSDMPVSTRRWESLVKDSGECEDWRELRKIKARYRCQRNFDRPVTGFWYIYQAFVLFQ